VRDLIKTGLLVALIPGVALLTSCSPATEPAYRHADEPIGTVREIYDGKLYADIQVNTFRNIDRLFPTRVVHRGETSQALPVALQSLSDFRVNTNNTSYDLYDVLSLNRVSGLLILHRGEVVFEKYLLGNDEHTRWMSMSVVKSITATLVGAAIQDGYIDSIDDAIVQYLPRLQGSAYDGVSIRQLLQMSSGVAWNETYTDPNSDRRHMLEAQIGQQPGAILDLMAALPRAAAPGTRWNYSTGETHVVGALLRAAIDKPVADYLSEKIWSKMGMQADANWWLESPDGLEVGGSGLSATLRDYARFGLFMLNDGVANGERVLPEGWVAEASARQGVGGALIDYGYMWWPMHGRSFSAIGIFGQYVFVDPDRQLVVALWSAQPKPLDRHGVDETAFLQALSAYFE
jgi:CubicO group peptidase (beta-lactamase class C family)